MSASSATPSASDVSAASFGSVPAASASAAAAVGASASEAAESSEAAEEPLAAVTPPPPASPSRSSSASSASSSAGSSPLLVAQSLKPRPLQLEADDGGPPLASEAQSPLYYVPQHLLFTPHTSHQSAAAATSGHAFFTQPAFAYAASSTGYSPSPSPIHLGAYPRSSAYPFSSHMPLTPTGGHHSAAPNGSPVSYLADGGSLGYGSSHGAGPQLYHMSGMVPSPSHALPSPAFTFSPLPAFSSSPLPLSPLSELTYASIPSPSHGSSHSTSAAAALGMSSGSDGSTAYYHSAVPSASSFPFTSSAAAAVHSAQQAAFANGYLTRDHSGHSGSAGSPTAVHSMARSSVVPMGPSFGSSGAIPIDGSGRPSSTSFSSGLSHHSQSFGSSVDMLLPSLPPSAVSHPGAFSASHPALAAFSHLNLESSYTLYSPPFGSPLPGLSNTSMPNQPAMLHSSARLPATSQTTRHQQSQQPQQQLHHHQPLQQPHGQRHQALQQQRGGSLSRSRPLSGSFSQSAPQAASSASSAPFQSATRRGMNGTHVQLQHNQPFGAAATGERAKGANGYNAKHAPQSALATSAAALATATLPFAATDGQTAQTSWSGGASLSPSPPPLISAAAPAQPAASKVSSHSLPLPLSAGLSASSGRVSPSPPSLLTVESLAGQVVRLCKTHTGSRFVQQKLEQRDAAYFDVMFNEMAGSIVELACDNFGSAHAQLRTTQRASNQSVDSLLLVSLSRPSVSVCPCVRLFVCQSFRC